MRTFKIMVMACGLAALPALAADRQYQTPSGMAEAVWRQTDVGTASGQVANACINMGWVIVAQNGAQVICEAKLSFGKALLSQLFLGNRWSTTPRQFVRTSLAQIGGDTRAQATAWVETTMAFGQTRSAASTGNTTFNTLMQFLIAAGGQAPGAAGYANMGSSPAPGAGAPAGGPKMGVDLSKCSDFVIKQITRTGCRIRKLFPRSAAADAGMRFADVIVTINGAYFPAVDDMAGLIQAVPLGKTYKVGVLRNGEPMEFTLESRPY